MVQMRYLPRKGVMRQDCFTAALPIVLMSLCLLSRCHANNGNGKLSLDEYFVHQQSVIQHLWRWRAPECESADDTDTEQLATAHCSSAQLSGGGSALL